MTPGEVLIPAAISSWEQVVARVGTLCLSCTEEQLLVEVAPGKNRIIYLWGHLTAIHDAMFNVLRLGERLHPELDAVFIARPDAGRGGLKHSVPTRFITCSHDETAVWMSTSSDAIESWLLSFTCDNSWPWLRRIAIPKGRH